MLVPLLTICLDMMVSFLSLTKYLCSFIIFAAKNNGDAEMQNLVRTDQIQCIEKMLSLKAPVLLVTNDCVLTGKFAKCNEAVINFGVPEEVCMFAFALFAQMFACKISCGIGNNPDSPRALNKVTITK